MSIARPLSLLLVAALWAGLAPVAAFAAGGSQKKVTAAEDWIELPSITASVVADFQVRGVLHVEAGLVIEDVALRARAQAMAPRLRAACAEALRGYAGDQYAHGRVPDVERIRLLMQTSIDRALAEDGAELLLGMVIVHNARR